MILDELDLQVINHLAMDGRTSGEKIAHKLGINEGTCRFRMRKLIDNIVHVKTFVNPTMVGFPVAAFLGFKVQPKRVTAAVAKLEKHRRIVQVSAVTGMFDVVGLAVFSSGRDVTSVMQEFSTDIKGVRDIQAVMCLETVLGFHVRISPDLLHEDGTRSELDEVDKKIISCLIDNGRLNAREIAHMLSIGEAPIRRRLKQLLNDKVIVVSAVVDAKRVGFPIVALIGFKVELPKIKKVATALARNRQINYVTTCAGIFDILAAGLYRSTEGLMETLQAFVSQIDGIKDTHTFICFEANESGSSLWVPRGLIFDVDTLSPLSDDSRL